MLFGISAAAGGCTLACLSPLSRTLLQRHLLTVLMLLALRLGEPVSKQALIFRVCLRDLTGQTLHDATTLSKASGADGW
jgi:hypothetical protein